METREPLVNYEICDFLEQFVSHLYANNSLKAENKMPFNSNAAMRCCNLCLHSLFSCDKSDFVHNFKELYHEQVDSKVVDDDEDDVCDTLVQQVCPSCYEVPTCPV